MLMLGPVAFLFFGYLNMHCNITVVNCNRVLCKRTGRPNLRYEELVEESLLLYATGDKAKTWRWGATIARKMAVVMLVLSQLGIMSYYVQIIGTTLQEKLQRASSGYQLPLQVTELLVLVFLLPYSWVSNLRVLSWLSVFANGLNVVCIFVIIQLASRNMKPVSEFPPVSEDLWTLPLFISAAVFTVEGIAMVIPIENKMKDPQSLVGFCGVLTVASTLNTCLNAAVGFYGYLAYGESVPGNILVALPGGWVYTTMALLYVIMVFLTFNLQLYMPAEIACLWLKQKFKDGLVHTYSDVLGRTAIVIFVYLFAALVPKVDLLMALVGAFTNTNLVFVFPPVAQLLILYKQDGRLAWYIVMKNVAIVIFGLLVFLLGTYTSVRDIIRSF